MAQKTTVKPRALKAGKSAEYLGISRRFLHSLSKEGRIPYSRISPRTLVYDVADLDAFLESCKIGGEQ